MSDKKVQRSSRVLSAEEKARLGDVRKQVEAEKDDILSQAREVFRRHEETIAILQDSLVADSMAEHPNKQIRQAIRYAEQNGWTFMKAGPRAHIFGQLYCPRHGRDGHIVRVHSTPMDPESHARKVRRAVENCDH